MRDGKIVECKVCFVMMIGYFDYKMFLGWIYVAVSLDLIHFFLFFNQFFLNNF